MSADDTSDKGTWHASLKPMTHEVYLESDDFEHDVRLYVNGDFEDEHQALAYASELAQRLNRTKPEGGGSR